jgi:hypothetical protein
MVLHPHPLVVQPLRVLPSYRRAGVYDPAMTSQISEEQSQIFLEEIVPPFIMLLDEAPPLDEAAGLEELAATLLTALEQPDMPAEVAHSVVDAIEGRRNVNAAGVLGAVGVLAAEPLAAYARACAQRLATDGIVSPAASEIGTLTVREAVRLADGDAELLVVMLGRPGAEEVRAAMLGIEHEETGGALVECGLAPPAPLSDARELLKGADDVGALQPIAADEVTARVLAAASRAVELEIALGHRAGPALPIISRALTGDPRALARPELLAPWEDDDPELIVDAVEDEDGFHRLMEVLLDEFEQYAKAAYPGDSVVWEHGDFVASTMLQWKGGYDDGCLGRWTPIDLAEYLLDYFPRKVSIDEEAVDAIPECVRAFLGFLDARGSLSGASLEELEQACETLEDEFDERARDSSHWGLAKSLVTRMQAEGVDPSAPGLSAGAGSRAPKQRAERRKAQRAARKRNRRR